MSSEALPRTSAACFDAEARRRGAGRGETRKGSALRSLPGRELRGS